MRYRKASPACWRSNAAVRSCTRSSMARPRSIRCFGLKLRSLAGWDSGFRSNSGALARAPKVLSSAWRTGAAIGAGTLYRHLVGRADHRRNRRRSGSSGMVAAAGVWRGQCRGASNTGRAQPGSGANLMGPSAMLAPGTREVGDGQAGVPGRTVRRPAFRP